MRDDKAGNQEVGGGIDSAIRIECFDVDVTNIDDLVELIIATAGDAGYAGAVNATAPNPVRNAELTRALGKVLRRPTLLPAPAFAIRAALGELADELLGSRRVIPGRALARGFEFRYPDLEDALEAELS